MKQLDDNIIELFFYFHVHVKKYGRNSLAGKKLNHEGHRQPSQRENPTTADFFLESPAHTLHWLRGMV
jgi:hypothetical protein